jgi:multidrug transporter EmrE-like cation transporter
VVHQPQRSQDGSGVWIVTATTAGVILVILCSIVEGVAQVFFKKSALVPRQKARWVSAGIALFIVQALAYTGALQFVEVSTAFPLGSIGFVIVAMLSQRMLGEPVTRMRWVGIVFIIAGVSLLASRA